MYRFYREDNGDYLVVDTATIAYYKTHFGKDHFDGRATAIAGLITSVQSTSISRAFIKESCVPVKRQDVPKEWLEMFFGWNLKKGKPNGPPQKRLA